MRVLFEEINNFMRLEIIELFLLEPRDPHCCGFNAEAAGSPDRVHRLNGAEILSASVKKHNSARFVAAI